MKTIYYFGFDFKFGRNCTTGDDNHMAGVWYAFPSREERDRWEEKSYQRESVTKTELLKMLKIRREDTENYEHFMIEAEGDVMDKTNYGKNN